MAIDLRIYMWEAEKAMNRREDDPVKKFVTSEFFQACYAADDNFAPVNTVSFGYS